MVRVRRSSSVFVLFSDRVSVDLDAFFSGNVNVHARTRTLGISLVTGKTMELTPSMLSLFAALSSTTWTALDQVDSGYGLEPRHLDELIENGFLLTDSTERLAVQLRERDARLDGYNWDPCQALAYVMSRWENDHPGHLEGRSARVLVDYESNVRAYGTPPGHFHEVNAVERLTLPDVEPTNELLQTLVARYTARGFRTDMPMPLEDLSVLLHFTFGAQAEISLAEGFSVLKKTSPSGGALHPVEAYPLIMNVDGLDCGIYHYEVAANALGPVTSMTPDEARKTALQLTSGQDYFASADLLIVMTGRFDRSFWKYRNHAKARKVIDLDAGHLSQTFYLLATHMGYGPFITAAVSDGAIEELLGLTYLEEGAIAVVGCGTPLEGQDRLAS